MQIKDVDVWYQNQIGKNIENIADSFNISIDEALVSIRREDLKYILFSLQKEIKNCSTEKEVGELAIDMAKQIYNYGKYLLKNKKRNEK